LKKRAYFFPTNCSQSISALHHGIQKSVFQSGGRGEIDDDGVLDKTALLKEEIGLDDCGHLWIPRRLTFIHFCTLNICTVIGALTLPASVAVE
jgi:hypothetical protein